MYADGRHLGGDEEVCRLHESGELAAALQAYDAAPVGAQDPCILCGGARFVLCDTCSGSCKVFAEEDKAPARSGMGW